MQGLGGGRRLFHQRRILLRHAIHGGDRLIRLTDPQLLFFTGGSDFRHDIGHFAHAVDNALHGGTRSADMLIAGSHFTRRIIDQQLDFSGRFGGTLRQIAYFAGDHGKTAPLLTGACCFDCRIQGQNIGLEGNAVNHADDFCHLLRGGVNRRHGRHHVIDDSAAVTRGVRSRQRHLIGLTGVLGILSDGRGQLFHRRSSFFQRRCLLLSAGRQIKIAAGDLG